MIELEDQGLKSDFIIQQKTTALAVGIYYCAS